MKPNCLCLSLLTVIYASSLSWQVCAEELDTFRIFTDHKNRSIEAAIVNFDEQRETVTLQLPSKRKSEIKITALCSGDQEYIRDWGARKNLETSSRIEFKAKAKQTDKRLTNEFIWGTYYYDYVYECSLRNGSAYPLENIDLSYTIYWKQIPRGENSGETKVFSHKGVVNASSIPLRKHLYFTTDAVTITDRWEFQDGGSQGVHESELIGITVEIKMSSKDGMNATRELRIPEGFMLK